jgi:hypothetical protein
VAAEDPGACGARAKELAAPEARGSHAQKLPPAREVSYNGVLGGDMTVVTGSIRWTSNLLDRADVVARGGAGVARG